MHTNLLKTSAQAEIEIWMINATYIRKCGNEKGAGGKLAIWASKTYRGHCMPPKEDM